jgi:hypothetical protein
LSAIPPALVIDVLLVLLVAQLCYVFFPYRRRAFLPILLLAALGVAVGQLWDVLGIPDVRLGSANLLPGLVFAVALQPLASRLPIRFR